MIKCSIPLFRATLKGHTECSDGSQSSAHRHTPISLVAQVDGGRSAVGATALK